MIITIQSVSQDFTKTGKEYLKVTGITGDGKQTTKSIFDNLRNKWELLVENATLEFTMQKAGQFWNVADIKKPELPTGEKPPQEPAESPSTTPPKQYKRYERSPSETESIQKQTALKCATELISAFITLGKMKEIDADTPAKLASQTIQVAKRLYSNWLISTEKVVEEIEKITEP